MSKTVPKRYDFGVMLEVYDFLNAVRERRRPELDGLDGLKAQAVPIVFFESATYCLDLL